jgi:hypothetical protein
MIIFESTLTTFEASFIFWGSWGSIKNWLELKIEPPLADLALLNPWNTLYLFFVEHKTISKHGKKMLVYRRYYFKRGSLIIVFWGANLKFGWNASKFCLLCNTCRYQWTCTKTVKYKSIFIAWNMLIILATQAFQNFTLNPIA